MRLARQTLCKSSTDLLNPAAELLWPWPPTGYQTILHLYPSHFPLGLRNCEDKPLSGLGEECLRQAHLFLNPQLHLLKPQVQDSHHTSHPPAKNIHCSDYCLQFRSDSCLERSQSYLSITTIPQWSGSKGLDICRGNRYQSSPNEVWLQSLKTVTEFVLPLIEKPGEASSVKWKSRVPNVLAYKSHMTSPNKLVSDTLVVNSMLILWLLTWSLNDSLLGIIQRLSQTMIAQTLIHNCLVYAGTEIDERPFTFGAMDARNSRNKECSYCGAVLFAKSLNLAASLWRQWSRRGVTL